MALFKRLFPPKPDPEAEKERLVLSFQDKAGDLRAMERRTEMRIRKAMAEGAQAHTANNTTRKRLAAVTVLRGRGKISRIQEQIWLLEESADAVDSLGIQEGIVRTVEEVNKIRGTTKVSARDAVTGLVKILQADGQRAPELDEYLTRILGPESSELAYDPAQENPAISDVMKEFEEAARTQRSRESPTRTAETSASVAEPAFDPDDIFRQIQEAKKGNA